MDFPHSTDDWKTCQQWPRTPDSNTGGVLSPERKIAAAHNAQMDATMAAVRADFDAKIAELTADLEATRGEKEKLDTDLACLKASSRTERLQWSKERQTFSRKIAEADARAREALDGIASADEFVALQKSLSTHEATIESLRKELDSKMAQHDKLELEAACASSVQNDVDVLMVRVATLEQTLVQEREARKAAEQEAQTLSAETRGLERRLAAALEAASRADESAAASIEDASKVMAEIREARAGQRNAELWLEKCLAEVDAVHAALAHERSIAATAGGVLKTPMTMRQQQQRIFAPYPSEDTIQTPQPKPQQPCPPSPSHNGADPESSIEVWSATVGPTAQTPAPYSPESAVISLNGDGGRGVVDNQSGRCTAAAAAADAAYATTTAGSMLPSLPATPASAVQGHHRRDEQTPDLDVTRPEPFSTILLRSRVGQRQGRGEPGGDGGVSVERGDYIGDGLPLTTARSEERGRDRSLSPPTPTVLFGDPADGDASAVGRLQSVSALASSAPRGVEDGYPDRERLLVGGGSTETTAGLAHPQAEAGGDRASVANGGKADCDDGHGSTPAVVAMRMATTPTKENRSPSRAGEDVAASLLSMLRLEKSKRKQAETKVVELEVAAAAAATAAASAAAPTTVCPPQQTGSSNGGTGPSGSQVNGTNPNQQQTDPDWCAQDAKVERERQGALILALVRDARNKLESEEPVKDSGVCRNHIGKGIGSASVGTFHLATCNGSSSAYGDSSPSVEVASLIQRFDEKLTRSVEDNAQLRVFCAHLEGLLATADTAPDGDISAAAGVRSKAVEREWAITGIGSRRTRTSPFTGIANGTSGVRAGSGVSGGNINSRVAEGSDKTPLRQSLGRRKGSPLSWPFQEIC